jgi:hypothetical protein
MGPCRSPSEQLEVLVAGEPLVEDGVLRAVAELSAAGDGAAVGGEGADEDLHQRALAGAVLADEADDLPGRSATSAPRSTCGGAAAGPHAGAVGLGDTRGEEHGVPVVRGRAAGRGLGVVAVDPM